MLGIFFYFHNNKLGLSTMSKLFLLVDMDGVLADFEAGFLEKFRKLYPNKPNIPLEDSKSFSVVQAYQTAFGLGAEAKGIIESKGFFFDLPPVVGAIETLHYLDERDDIELFICTSPLKLYQFCVLEKFKWIDKYLGPKFAEKIILTRDKTLVNGHFLIDDKPHITGTQIPQWKHILFETHHNRHLSPHRDQFKVCGWKDNLLLQIFDDKLKSMRNN